MTFQRIEAGYGRLLILAMEHDFPSRMEDWKEHLREGRMTPEMRDVFTAMGYTLPRMRSTKKVKPLETDESAEEIAKREADVVESMHTAEPTLIDKAADEFIRFAHGDEPVSDYEEDLNLR